MARAEREKKPALVGTAGHIEGEEMVLDYGKTVVVGRSRSADLSLRRLPHVAELSDEDRQNDHDLRTVSGKHFEITPFSEESIEIVNLSPNGTYVDGKRVDKVVLDDVADKPYEIKIGAKETLRLELREAADAAGDVGDGAGDGNGADAAAGHDKGPEDGSVDSSEEPGK